MLIPNLFVKNKPWQVDMSLYQLISDFVFNRNFTY